MKITKHRRSAKCRKVSIPPMRVSTDYPWKVLSALTLDLASYLTKQDLQTVRDIIRKRDIPAVIGLADTWGLQSINLLNWYNVSEIAAKYQLASLLKRYPFATSKQSREDMAYDKFIKAEEQCRTFNQVAWKDLASPSSDDVTSVFTYARSFILRVIGDSPVFSWVTKRSRHGPGATLSTTNGFNSVYEKYRSWPYDVTKAATGHARRLIENDERWLGALEDSYRDVMEIPKHRILNRHAFWVNVFNVVKGNRVAFVPKDAQTERTIAIEPTLNLYLQLGVDGYIRKRLKSFGINLDDQEKNQDLAEIGSKTGEYATLDLKAASDTVSLRICKMLLPPIWYDYLLDLRSPCGELRGETISYEKISSMGNGYTFALESLVFASVIYGVLKHFKGGKINFLDFSVFGDDLVIRTEYAQELIFYLRRFGFSINSEKSFLQGPIRESCGTDWFRGHLIRPVFVDEFPTTPKQLFSIRNRLRRKLENQWSINESQSQRLLDKWCPENLLGLIGPPSNEDFDSYRHMSYPFGIKYTRGHYWEFERLVYKPIPFSGREFHFRKLMSSLGEKDEFRFVNKRDLVVVAGLKGGGSCFTVTRRNRVTMSVVTSQAWYWPETYLT